MRVKNNSRALTQLMMMLILTFVAQLITLVKASKTASMFGVTVDMDIFNYVNNLATFLFSFLGSGISTVLVPVFSKNKINKVAVNTFITVLYGIALLILFLFIFFRVILFTTFTEYTGYYLKLACRLLITVMISQYINSINNIFISYLQCQNIFNIPKIISIGAVSGITLSVFLVSKMNIELYSFFTLFFLLCETIVLGLYSLKKGFRYFPKIEIFDNELKRMIRTFIPSVLGSGVYQVTLLTDSIISSSLGQGSLSVLSYSNTIAGMINSIICANVISYVYPKIASEHDNDQSTRRLFQYLVFFAFIMCFLMIAFFCLGKDAIRILFQRGMFNDTATFMVYNCVLIYIIGYPFNIMRDLLYRYFYSQGNTKSTFYNGLITSILNIVLSILLSRLYGLNGIVFATTVTAVFSFFSILYRFKKRYYTNKSLYLLLRELFKLLVSTIFALISCLITRTFLITYSCIIVSGISFFVGMIVYVVLLFVLKSQFYKVEF